MILPVQDTVRREIAAALVRRFELAKADLPAIVLETPPLRTMGDLASPVAFELARKLRKAPRVIAQELADALGAVPGVARTIAVPNGYLNLFLDRAPFIRSRLGPTGIASPTPSSDKTIVEHTAINPNKAAHVGHLRNAALGDSLGRLLRFKGIPVEIQNYIDDTGVQVADVVVGFRELEGKDLDAVRSVAAGARFDCYCWDLYARVTEWYEQDPERLKIRTSTLHSIERGGNDDAALAAFIADRIVRCHLETMGRMNVDYDLLTWEGDILRRRFWAHAFEILKANGTMFLQQEGRLAGCWVMRIEDDAEAAPSADEAAEASDADEPREKVIVRSDGTVTYVGKDIAYQFWKFGLLGRDFHYRVFGTRRDGTPLWATCSEREPLAPGLSPPPFGGARAVYNVIDTRQAYLQKLLKQALAAMGHVRESEHSVHFSYEMVALSHETARELGYDTSEQAGRPFVEVSGRKGLGVKADDLLDRLEAKAAHEVGRRNPEFAPEEIQRIARMIATSAVRYFMVKYSRGKVITFDIDEALSFEGESGPYLQYSVVRSANIFNKLREREQVGENDVVAAVGELSPDALEAEEALDLWNLVLEASRLDEVVDQSIRTLELSVLAKYLFGLAQMFNTFYQKYPILNESRTDVRLWRAAAVSYFKAQMTAALSLMGCEVPPRM